MGTRIATDTAASFPERVSKLVLMEGISTQTSSPDEAPTVLRKAVEDMKKADAPRKPVYETREEAILARPQAIGGAAAHSAVAAWKTWPMALPGALTPA